jgi:hypothetical protein
MESTSLAIRVNKKHIMKNNSHSIKPILRTDKPKKENGKYPINFLVRIGKTQIKIPAKKEIEEMYWDNGKVSRKHPSSTYLNGYFLKRISEFEAFINQSDWAEKVVNCKFRAN